MRTRNVVMYAKILEALLLPCSCDDENETDDSILAGPAPSDNSLVEDGIC